MRLHHIISLSFVLGALPQAALPASFSVYDRPSDSYLTNPVATSISAADGAILNSLSNTVTNVAFSSGLQAASVPATWDSWGAPPYVQSSTPRVLFSTGTALTLTFSNPVGFFGLEAQPNSFDPYTISVQFYSGSSLTGSISQLVDGNGGARLFAAGTDSSFTRAVLSTSDADGFGIAQVRAGAVTPEPASASLFAVALAGAVLLFLRRKLQQN